MQITPSTTRVTSHFKAQKRSTNPLRKHRSSSSSSSSASPQPSTRHSTTSGISKPSSSKPNTRLPPLTPPPPPSTNSYIPASAFIHSLFSDTAAITTVAAAITHIRKTLFTPLPADFTGLPTHLIAPLLQFREAAPPYVPLPLLNATIAATPTAVAREIAKQVEDGLLRRLSVNGDEGVISTEFMYNLINQSEVLENGLKTKLVSYLKVNPGKERTSSREWQWDEIRELMDAGFLVLSQTAVSAPAVSIGGGTSTLVSSCAVHASGTTSASGGRGIVISASSPSSPPLTEYAITLPSLGRFLGVLRRARGELKAMIPKKGGCTVKALRERWDGQWDREKALGRLKKWREYYGVGFEGLVGALLGGGEAEVWRIVGGSGEFGIRVR